VSATQFTCQYGDVNSVVLERLTRFFPKRARCRCNSIWRRTCLGWRSDSRSCGGDSRADRERLAVQWSLGPCGFRPRLRARGRGPKSRPQGQTSGRGRPHEGVYPDRGRGQRAWSIRSVDSSFPAVPQRASQRDGAGAFDREGDRGRARGEVYERGDRERGRSSLIPASRS